MQRPVRGYRYRGGIRIGPHFTHSHRNKENDDADNDNRVSLSNSNSDEIEDENNEKDSTIKSESPSIISSITPSTDLESVIRDLRPLLTRPKKNKIKAKLSNQKIDVPQLNIIVDTNTNTNEKTPQYWFPKADMGPVDSSDFFRHNHTESKPTTEESMPPASLTTNPPIGISTRPTAIVAPAGTTRSASAFFTSNSCIKKANNNSTYDFRNTSTIKSDPQPIISSFIQTASSAFQPIDSTQKSSSITKTKSQPALMDISKHKALEPGEILSKVHISHPQSPLIVHIMLHEDFDTACRLLHKMAVHPELQSDYIPTHPFKPKRNDICACFHEGRWFRCRILQLSSDLTTATVVYLDWGMTISVQIHSDYIRYLPSEFYIEPACSILCHLDGVSNQNDSVPSDIIAQCIALLSENEYDVTVNDYHSKTGGKIILSIDGRNINDQIQQLLFSNKSMSVEDELIEQFQHQIQLSVGDELQALLSSFSGDDDSFYVLLNNDKTSAIDRAMNELQEDQIPNREFLQVPQIKTLVVARYGDDGKYYRAWVKTVDIDQEQALVFFVDFGNESKVLFSDIYICPESVRTYPWLGIRVRLTSESMTPEELTRFWKLTESHYIWIRINEVLKDSYDIQIKIDYTVFLRQERSKLLSAKRLTHKSVQTKLPTQSACVRNSSERSSCLSTTSLSEQNQIGNENLLRNLFDMINNELRSLRHRINDSNEASQDRHSQLMQLLFSMVNLNNSNNQKKLC